MTKKGNPINVQCDGVVSLNFENNKEDFLTIQTIVFQRYFLGSAKINLDIIDGTPNRYIKALNPYLKGLAINCASIFKTFPSEYKAFEIVSR